jgi:hypothetical protein
MRLRFARCQCGQTEMELRAEPIVTAACYCTSCQTAGEKLVSMGAAPVLTDDGGTEFILYRKDRVTCTKGATHLREFYLTPQSSTRRVVATCCNSPLFLEFKGGHWLSLYLDRIVPEDRPAIQLRTMIADRREGVTFSDSIPSYKKHSAKFMWQLLSAWARMGFRAPKIVYVAGTFGAGAYTTTVNPQDGT